MRALVLSMVGVSALFAQQPARHAPVRVSGGAIAGSILTKVLPVFPEEAKRQRVNGTVVMHAIIGADGRIKELSVISGPEILRSSYLTAVRQWTYRPYLREGKPMEVETTITVSIQMGAASAQPN